jgi:hypothetical protein
VPHTRLDVSVDDLRLIGAAPGGAKGKEERSGETKEADPDLDLGGAELTGELADEN